MAYKQRWLEYFELLDADKSGFIDLGDLANATDMYSKVLRKPADSADVKGAVAVYRKFFELLIKDFDTNKDGKVSKEELLSGVEKHFIGKKASELPAWWKEQVTAAFNFFDIDKDGSLSLEETTKNFQSLSKNTSAEDLAKAYNWVASHSASGKFDGPAYSDLIVYNWATSPDTIPEVYTLTPYFRPHDKR
eukprot:Phypoly_transcript_18472.p1 GENE.Phypoly_transcript_18472~~Phypoly_transcript_18472.p1  ORF type:complete len:202 (+),score=49.84 Phypoly_transcript_18472:34-606(+)